MDNIRLYEDFLDASQEDIIPQETVVAENEPEVNAQNYRFLFNFYFNLKALQWYNTERMLKHLHRLERVLGHICKNFSKPEIVFKDRYFPIGREVGDMYFKVDEGVAVRFAANVSINSIQQYVRFFGSIINAMQLNIDLYFYWCTDFDVYGNAFFGDWGSDSTNNLSIKSFYPLCDATKFELLMPIPFIRGKKLSYVEQRNAMINLPIIKKFIHRDDIWRQLYELIGYDWTTTGLDSIVDDYHLASIKDDIVRPWHEAQIDTEQLIRGRVSYYVEFFESCSDHSSYFNPGRDLEFVNELLEPIRQGKTHISNIFLLDSKKVNQKEFAVVFLIEPYMTVYNGTVSLKFYLEREYNDWKDIVEFPKQVLVQTPEVAAAQKLWEEMFEQWYNNAKTCRLVESAALYEDFLDVHDANDIISKEPDAIDDEPDNPEDYQRVIYLEISSFGDDEFRRMKRRLSNTLRSLPYITEFSKPRIVTDYYPTARTSDLIEYDDEWIDKMKIRRNSLIIAVGVSYLDDLSPKSIMGLLEAVRWKTTSPDFNPYAIGVVDSERPVNRSYLPCDNLQKMSIAWHRDADIRIDDLRPIIRMISLFNKGTFFLRDLLETLHCPKILASNMEFKILSSVLNAPALPWESVHNIDLMDMIYQTPITSATYDHSQVKYLRNPLSDTGQFQVYKAGNLRNNNSLAFCCDKIDSEKTLPQFVNVWRSRDNQQICIHICIGEYYYPAGDEYQQYGFCYILDVDEKNIDSARECLARGFKWNNEQLNVLFNLLK